jgi:hypothetical protein
MFNGRDVAGRNCPRVCMKGVADESAKLWLGSLRLCWDDSKGSVVYIHINSIENQVRRTVCTVRELAFEDQTYGATWREGRMIRADLVAKIS